MRRSSNRQRAENLAEIKAISTRYVTEEGLSIYTGISAKTFNTLRGKTPKRWDSEELKKTIEKGDLVGPPFRTVGKVRIYDLKEIDAWMKLFPEWGILPGKPEKKEEQL